MILSKSKKLPWLPAEKFQNFTCCDLLISPVKLNNSPAGE